MPTLESKRFRAACVIVAVLGTACTWPSYTPRPEYALAPIDDSTVVTEPLRWVLYAGDEWVRIRVSNAGVNPVVVSWGGAQWVSTDGVVHRLVEASQFHDFMTMYQAALAEEAMLPLTAADEAMLISRRQASWLKHRAPAALRSDGESRIGQGETAEWVMYPAEHVGIDVFGNITVEPLWEAHPFPGDDPLRPFFSVLMPIRVEGRWTTIAVPARGGPPGREPTGSVPRHLRHLRRRGDGRVRVGVRAAPGVLHNRATDADARDEHAEALRWERRRGVRESACAFNRPGELQEPPHPYCADWSFPGLVWNRRCQQRAHAMTTEAAHSREVQLKMSCGFCSAHILVGLAELRSGRLFCGVCERTSEANIAELRSFAANLDATLAALEAAAGPGMQ